jgi:hypothetical protein
MLPFSVSAHDRYWTEVIMLILPQMSTIASPLRQMTSYETQVTYRSANERHDDVYRRASQRI